MNMRLLMFLVSWLVAGAVGSSVSSTAISKTFTILPAHERIITYSSSLKTRRAHTTFVPRGGGEASSSSSAVKDLVGWIGPVLSSVGEAVRKHVEPVLQDPNGAVNAFANARINNAKSRAHGMAAMEALALVTLPGRTVQLFLWSFLLSEICEKVGLLEDPEKAKDKILSVWRKAKKIPLNEWQTRAENIFKRQFKPGGLFHGWSRPAEKVATFAPKHQLAIGIAVGWVASPVMFSLAISLLESTAVVYVISELNEAAKSTTGGKSVLQKMSDSLGGFPIEQIELKLDTVRTAIRKSIQEPDKIIGRLAEAIDKYDDGLAPSTKLGLVIGLSTGILI